ncbi:MAG: NAD-dependent epimerase/dehydratase family protein [Proteobacteria bacterium]|nr:NAD-dependent epimerase/dehydratase family protein [Pseudomonadota bacterium]
MNLLVTGGAGLLGSHLCDRLIGEDRDVLCLDHFVTGSKLKQSFILVIFFQQPVGYLKCAVTKHPNRLSTSDFMNGLTLYNKMTVKILFDTLVIFKPPAVKFFRRDILK